MKKTSFQSLILWMMSISFCAHAACDENGKCIYDCSPEGATATCTAVFENGILTISGEGKMKDYKYEGTSGSWHVVDVPWKNQINQIENVVIAGKITSVGEGTFTGSASLKNVTLSENVETIGKLSFIESHLENINLENVVDIRPAAFARTNLREVTLSNELERIGWQAFDGTKLNTLFIPDFVYSIGWAAFVETSTKIYCNNEGHRCDDLFFGDTDTGLKQNQLIKYEKEGDRYILDGHKYKSLSDMQKNEPVKRIYTIEEANLVAKPSGNTIKIRYK